MTRREHKDICALTQAPLKGDIRHLKEGQERVEKKIDSVDKKVGATLEVLHKMNGDE